MVRKINIALAGNPNCGKTALFNILTSSAQRVGNWPGVTVSYKQGGYEESGCAVTVVDLPGVYSLSANCSESAADERVSCEYLLTQPIDLIVNVINANNLERNLYLTTQLLEMGIPVIMVINMMDVARQNGIQIQLNELSQALGCHVVPMVAKKSKGLAQLKKTIMQVIQHPSPSPTPALVLHQSVQSALLKLENLISQSLLPYASINHHWMAIKLLEGNLVLAHESKQDLMLAAHQAIEAVKQQTAEEPDILIADARYAFIHKMVHPLIKVVPTKQKTITHCIDKIVLNKYLGIPVFFLIVYSLFYFAINITGAFQEFFDIVGDALFVKGFAAWLSIWHAPPWLTTIFAYGAGKGLSTTLTFVPVIAGMFFGLSLLEDSGYMVRAVFVVDRMMRLIGLSGKAFLPIMMGFGCNVPAIMVTRTLENPRDRILTIMMLPFMTCGARLAIFAVFASAFFPVGGQNIIFALYLVGILFAVFTGFFLRNTLLKGDLTPLVMELPAYHLPHLRSLWRLTVDRVKGFVMKAGKVILPFAIVLGTLNTLTFQGKFVHRDTPEQSILSVTSRIVTPIFSPMGITQENWPATVGLMAGVVAKEVVVGTLNALYSQQLHLNTRVSQASPSSMLKAAFTDALHSIRENFKHLHLNPQRGIVEDAASDAAHPVYGLMSKHFGGNVAAFAYLLFVLLYFPCVATLAVMCREAGIRWTWFSLCWTTGLAYLVSILFYQALSIAQHPVKSLSWVVGIIIIFVISGIVLSRFMTDADKEVKK
jgi:ferrous iron transport protein B